VDEFLTSEEIAFRREARDYFRRLGAFPRTPDPSRADVIWQDLAGARDTFPSPGGCVTIVEAAAGRDPMLGRDLLDRFAASGRLGPEEERLCRFARLSGTAAYVFEAGAGAARERGAFASSLMGCRETQERLAALVSKTELLRLATLRICRLLDRGERDLAGTESARLRDLVLSLARDVRSAALALLGEPWVEANLPPDAPPSDDERNRP